jgi:hypothetical protein
LQSKIEESSTTFNTDIQDTSLAEHNSTTSDAKFEFKPIPIKTAFLKIMETHKETMVAMFQEIIRGRLLIYYLRNFPITFESCNKRIP